MEDSKQLVELRRDKRLFELPNDILDTLCDNLSIKDQFRFARVCKSAHSLVYERVNPIALDSPWLIGLTDNSSSLFETTHNGQVTCYKIGTRPFKFSEPNIVGYCKGWFYIQYPRNRSIQLVNLFINVQIDLPPLSTIYNKHKFKRRRGLYAQAFALSLCKSMRPLMIAIVYQYGNLALCKTTGCGTWKAHKYHRQDKGYYINVTFYHEKLYAMKGQIFQTVDIFKIGDDDLRLFPVGVIEYKNVVNNLSLLKSIVQQVYLVEDSKGDNMFIVKEYHLLYTLTVVFEVFKVVNDGEEFVRMEDLGDQIILLDNWCSEIIDVKDCSPSKIFKGNQICFKGFFDQPVGIYSLENRIINWAYPAKAPQCRRWIFPRFITTAKCHCKSH